jgi:hypothetical protein
VILTGVTAAAMLMLTDCVAVCAVGVVESVTFTVKVEVPVPVGVPEMTPEELRLRPIGSAPELTDQVYGVVPPVAPREVE